MHRRKQNKNDAEEDKNVRCDVLNSYRYLLKFQQRSIVHNNRLQNVVLSSMKVTDATMKL